MHTHMHGHTHMHAHTLVLKSEKIIEYRKPKFDMTLSLINDVLFVFFSSNLLFNKQEELSKMTILTLNFLPFNHWCHHLPVIQI